MIRAFDLAGRQIMTIVDEVLKPWPLLDAMEIKGYRYENHPDGRAGIYTQ